MISVIIPIKNIENEYWDLLPRAIKSVLRQTFKDFELIVSIYNEEVSVGRNSGIAKAKGEWILTLDADDELTPNFLEEVYKNKGNYDIIATGALINGKLFIPEPHKGFESTNRILNCSLFKKEVWEKYHFNQDLKAYEDYDFWLKSIENGFKIGVVKTPLVNIYDRPNSRNKYASIHHDELINQIKNIKQC